MLQVKLLGDCAVVCRGQPIGGLHTDRLQALLAYLVLHHHAPQPRQRIAARLWPESTDTQARANLRKELSYLRRSLPDPEAVLWAETKTLQWQLGADCWVDVVAFESCLKTAEQATDLETARSHLTQAIDLYRGDLLPQCDDEWIVPERERLQQRYLRALTRLIEILEQSQDYPGAIALGQQLVQLDPFSEVAYCALMRLYGLRGDRANALQIYHRCRTVLREELGLDPSPTLRHLYEQLLNEPDRPLIQGDRPLSASSPDRASSSERARSLQSAGTLPLIGRNREWHTLQQWLTTAPTDRPLLVVMGEPGIGKTRLLQQMQDSLPPSTHVLWGRGFEAEIVRPYGIWIDAVRTLAAHTDVTIPAELSLLFPESSPNANLPGDRSRLFDAVVQYLSQLCQDNHSVLVVLDDIQWIDESSSALLHYISRVLSGFPIGFACTARSKELQDNEAVRRVTQALRREGRLQTLELAPLDPAHTAELVQLIQTHAQSHRQSTPGDTFTDFETLHKRIFVESGGNPLFALELARAWASGEPSHADDLELLICDRLQRLEASARDLIPWAAAWGQHFKPTLVAHVADYPLSKLLLAIEQLERESIIRASGGDREEISYDFAHDIVRQVAYRQLSEPRRRLVHLQIAQQLHRLADTHPDWMADIAHHAALGGDRTLAAAASLGAAQRSLKVFAYTEAAELAQRGMQHCQLLDDRTRIQIHLQLLQVRVTAGVTREQIPPLEQKIQDLIHQAHVLGLTEAEATGYEVLLILDFDANDFAKMQRRSQQMVEASRAANPATMARMLAYSGSCLAEIGRDMARAEALLLEARSLAERVGLEWIDIPCGLGCVHRFHGDYVQARSLLRHAVNRAKVEQDHWREYNSLSYLIMTELEDGQPQAALPYCQDLATVAAQMKGEGGEGAIAQALMALADYQIDASAATRALERAIATLQTWDIKRMLAYILVGAAEIDLQAGRFPLVRQRAEIALDMAQVMNQPSEQALAYSLLLQRAIATGESVSAMARVWLQALESCDRTVLSWRSRIQVDQVLQWDCLALSS